MYIHIHMCILILIDHRLLLVKSPFLDDQVSSLYPNAIITTSPLKQWSRSPGSMLNIPTKF